MGVCARRLGCAALVFALLAGAGPTPARAEASEIRIGYQYGFIYLPVEVAGFAGLIERRAKELGAGDVKVTMRQVSGTPAINDALVSDNLDFGALGLPGVLIAWDKTKGAIKGFVGLPLTAFVLYTNKPHIKSLRDFTDEDRIAYPATTSTQGILLRMAMEQTYGPGQYLRADKVMVSLPHPDAVTALLAGGTISGYFATPPFFQMLAKDSRVHKVIGSKEILGGYEASGGGLLATSRFVDANPILSKAVLLGIEDANRFIRERPREAAEIYIKAENSKMPVDEVAAITRDGSHVWQAEPAGTVAMGEFMARTGQLRTAPKSWKEVFFPILHDREGS
jgi:NitT/TauT family transport system substrate-binding protein